MSKPGAVAPTPSPHAEPPRRGFIKEFLAVLIGGLVGLVPLASGLAFFFDPLLRTRKSANGNGFDGFIKVTTTESIPDDGVPRAFKVIADKQDAWNKFPNTEIGAVYLRKGETGQVSCLNRRCPHLGCSVDYKVDKAAYVCPCHESIFQLDGGRTNSIPPRNMDELPVEIRHGNEVWVKFQNFAAGTADKKLV